MNHSPLLRQFIQESREFLESIGAMLMALEDKPSDAALMNDLFRVVHTLKGNSGLFDFPAMGRVLHAGEDLMDAVRDGRVPFSKELADVLLDAMDYVSVLIDDIESTGALDAAHTEYAQQRVQALRAFLAGVAQAADSAAGSDAGCALVSVPRPELPPLALLPEAARMAAWQAGAATQPLWRLGYYPEPDCYYKGEDPFYLARQLPGLAYGAVRYVGAGVQALDFDCYRCELVFDALARTSHAELQEHFRYVPEQIELASLHALELVQPQGDWNGGPIYGDFVTEAQALHAAGDWAQLQSAVEAMLEISGPRLWLSSALRWLRLLLQTESTPHWALRSLIDSINTLQAPDWRALLLQHASADAPAQLLGQQAGPLFAGGGAPGSEAAPSQADLVPNLEADPGAEAVAGAAGSQHAAAHARSAPRLEPEQLARLLSLIEAQRQALALPDQVEWFDGRVRAIAQSLRSLLSWSGLGPDPELEEAYALARQSRSSQPLRLWLDEAHPPSAERAQQAYAPGLEGAAAPRTRSAPAEVQGGAAPGASQRAQPQPAPAATPAPQPAAASATTAPRSEDGEPRFGRRADDAQAGKILKVDQGKVDRLMNLIGEMVVAKNSLPYLAKRAEEEYGMRELAREVKAQYSVINRIAEEMQDAIMQVRMMPVSFILQRFPRLVRDLSRKLGKEVELVLEGESTEADKNIVESLADPLIHIVRNSLDHGIEAPELRHASGKPAAGRIHIRALQESDHVIIEVSDDGRGIDPQLVKRKAYEKGLISEAQLESMSDEDAVQLVFLAGFSTVSAVSDLSGRGVGMDVVRNALHKVGGAVELSSVLGKGTTLRLALPLSMAVTNVMTIETAGQVFGVPMNLVVETVRLPHQAVRQLKQRNIGVLRGKIVPLVALNELLGFEAAPRRNADDEYAALVVRHGPEQVGLLVDDFLEVVDVILKPMPGELAALQAYAGTALLGDGSVLMVLNPKELL